MSKTYEVEELIHNLVRQHPLWPSTFSTCECQREMARGSGKCFRCITEDLSTYLPFDLVNNLHQTIIEFAELKREALDIAGELNDR